MMYKSYNLDRSDTPIDASRATIRLVQMLLFVGISSHVWIILGELHDESIEIRNMSR